MEMARPRGVGTREGRLPVEGHKGAERVCEQQALRALVHLLRQ